jgi:hypothetical protein
MGSKYLYTLVKGPFADFEKKTEEKCFVAMSLARQAEITIRNNEG